MNDIIDKLLLKRIFSGMRKASSHITDLKVKEITYNNKPFVCGAKINGVNINFTNGYSRNHPVITLKHGLLLRASSSNYHWVSKNDKLIKKTQFIPIDDNNILSHITLGMAKNQFSLSKRKNIETNLWIELDGKKSVKFELNDDLEFEFEDLPKNLYEWDEDHFLYYSLKKDQ